MWRKTRIATRIIHIFQEEVVQETPIRQPFLRSTFGNFRLFTLFTVMSHPIPSGDEKDEFLLSCRYGDLEDIQQFVEKYGAGCLDDIRDGSGNTALHMICANGHIGESFSIRPHPTIS